MKAVFLCEIEDIVNHVNDIKDCQLLMLLRKKGDVYDFQYIQEGLGYNYRWVFATYNGEFKYLYSDKIINEAVYDYDGVFIVDTSDHGTEYVYRIHCKDSIKRGCYRSGRDIGCYILKDHRPPFHDVFVEFEDIKVEGSFFNCFEGFLYCAVESKEKLYNLMRDDVDYNEPMYFDFVISEILPYSQVLYGEDQCLFEAANAEIVKSWSIAEFYELYGKGELKP